MRSKVITALAFAGLLMTAIPLTASAHDKATCTHEPAWGYQHPNWYKSWWQKSCGQYGYNGYGYNQNYLGNGGGGWWPSAPAYGQYQAPRYYSRNYNAGRDDWYDRDGGWLGNEHRGWDRGHDGDHGRHSHHR